MSVNTICCICHKTKSLYGWFDEFMEQYKKLSHPYCPECYRKIMERLQAGAEEAPPRRDHARQPQLCELRD